MVSESASFIKNAYDPNEDDTTYMYIVFWRMYVFSILFQLV